MTDSLFIDPLRAQTRAGLTTCAGNTCEGTCRRSHSESHGEPFQEAKLAAERPKRPLVNDHRLYASEAAASKSILRRDSPHRAVHFVPQLFER